MTGGADDAPDSPDLLGDKTEIVELAHAQPDVDMILDHVQAAIGEHHARIDVRMLPEEIRDDGKQVKPSKRDRR